MSRRLQLSDLLASCAKQDSRLCKACKKEIYHKGEGAPLPFVTFAFSRLSGGFAVMPSQKVLLSVRAYQVYWTGPSKPKCRWWSRLQERYSSLHEEKQRPSPLFFIPLRIQDSVQSMQKRSITNNKTAISMAFSKYESLRCPCSRELFSLCFLQGLKFRRCYWWQVASWTSLLVFNFPTKTTSIR